MQAEKYNFKGDSLWALLISIDDYKAGLQKLNGCVNDVEAIQVFLINQLGVSEDHICMLTNEQATRAAILHTF